MRLFLFLSALLNGAQILHGLQDGAEHRLRAGGFAASALHLLQRWRRQQRPSPGHACSPPEVFQPEAETKKIFGLRRTRIDQVLKKLLVSTFFCFESITPLLQSFKFALFELKLPMRKAPVANNRIFTFTD